MTVVKEPFPHGTFCWPELLTTDAEGAKKFYSELFGWELRDDEMGPDQVYTMAMIEGDNVGAMYKRSAEQEKAGVPPHWLSYVSVDNVDDVVEKAKEYGGNVIASTVSRLPNQGTAIPFTSRDLTP